MSDEAAFLRAIQAHPTDATAKLVYADWLDEHGEPERAEYLRLSERIRSASERSAADQRRLDELEQRQRIWLGLVRASTPVWDDVTMFLLGRLQGLFDSYAILNGHESDIAYEFQAVLRPRVEPLSEMTDLHFGRNLSPVTFEALPDWETALGDIAGDWLFHELRHLRNPPHTRLAFLSGFGREAAVANALAHIRAVITPTAGWRVQVSTNNQFYALDWADVVLVSAERALFLHFSFSD